MFKSTSLRDSGSAYLVPYMHSVVLVNGIVPPKSRMILHTSINPIQVILPRCSQRAVAEMIPHPINRTIDISHQKSTPCQGNLQVSFLRQNFHSFSLLPTYNAKYIQLITQNSTLKALLIFQNFNTL